ncbi:hypothetical protein SAMN05216308_11645 [Nitrosospira sp. Nsp13]|nr:hypothetical protein SAMN05216308_11645 [Nitrosospira sp. Nsp13]
MLLLFRLYDIFKEGDIVMIYSSANFTILIGLFKRPLEYCQQWAGWGPHGQ